MNRKQLFASLLGMALIVFGAPVVAMAATKGDATPKARSGAVQIASAGATLVFTAMTGRNSFAVFNNGPNTIYCGFTSTVTTATGFPVIAGGSLSIDLVYNASGDQDFYCIAATAIQASPADTRWIQVK